jgi:hypothetical protein
VITLCLGGIGAAWCTKPISERKRRNCPFEIAHGSTFSTATDPALGRSEVAMRLSKLVFPEPDEPIIAIDSPAEALMLIFFSASFPLLWLKLTSLNEKAIFFT